MAALLYCVNWQLVLCETELAARTDCTHIKAVRCGQCIAEVHQPHRCLDHGHKPHRRSLLPGRLEVNVGGVQVLHSVHLRHNDGVGEDRCVQQSPHVVVEEGGVHCVDAHADGGVAELLRILRVGDCSR